MPEPSLTSLTSTKATYNGLPSSPQYCFFPVIAVSMLSGRLLTLLALPLLAAAHFHMVFPTPRSDEDETEGTGPCGGFPVSSTRTKVSMDAFPVALEMGHDRSVIQMLLALGNEPGNNFNITLEQTFQQQGEGDFCLPSVMVPNDLGVVDGTNGTLQVVTDGEGGGGLYIV
jgi:hypothetical protein